MANSTCAEIQHAKQEKRVENSTFAKKTRAFSNVVSTNVQSNWQILITFKGAVFDNKQANTKSTGGMAKPTCAC